MTHFLGSRMTEAVAAAACRWPRAFFQSPLRCRPAAPPMARFLIAPPKPDSMCPLQWLATIIAGTSWIAEATATSLSTGPAFTGTLSQPKSPSARMTGQPIDCGLIPFSFATSR